MLNSMHLMMLFFLQGPLVGAGPSVSRTASDFNKVHNYKGRQAAISEHQSINLVRNPAINKGLNASALAANQRECGANEEIVDSHGTVALGPQLGPRRTSA